MPSIWYLAGLHAPGIDAVGATIPGVPGIVIGRNRQIAWGMTASYVDDVDEVEEELSPDSTRVRRRSGWGPVEMVAETLLVRGSSAVTYTRRRTSNGPLVRWIRGTPPLAVARRWSGQDVTPAGLLASLTLMKAQDWAGFRAALRELRAPTLGLTYADGAGHIGYQLAGGVPVRAVDGVGSSGPGWTTDSAWHGYLPFDALPSALDAAPFLVTSNNRIVGADYPHFLSSAWASPYRAERIAQMLSADSSVSIADAARMQMDVTSLFALRAKPVAARAAATLGDSSVARALQEWDGSMRAESAEATLFWRWYEVVQEELRSIPAAFPATWAAQHHWILSDTVLLANGRSFSFDSLSTAAMRVALADPRARHAWGTVHQLVERHPLGDLPLLGRLLRLNIGPVGVPGGDFTVNLCASAGDRIPFTCTEGPSMRFLADMGSDQGSWFVLPAGQSGNPMSRHYRDQFPLWLHGRLAPLPVVPGTDSSGEILELVPGR
jgi:penicillin amidase